LTTSAPSEDLQRQLTDMHKHFTDRFLNLEHQRNTNVPDGAPLIREMIGSGFFVFFSLDSTLDAAPLARQQAAGKAL